MANVASVNFGDYMKNLRESKGLTINQLADVSGVSNAQISRIENSIRKEPRPETLKKLSIALGVSCEELMRAAGYLG